MIALLVACVHPAPEALPGPAGFAEGATVSVEGTLSTAIAQHLIAGVPGKQEAYVTVLGGDEMVVYVAAPIACEGPFTVTGRAFVAHGAGKRSKGQDHWEWQVDASSVVCAPTVPVAPARSAREECEARLAAAREAPSNGCPPCPCACLDDGSLNCAPCARCDPHEIEPLPVP